MPSNTPEYMKEYREDNKEYLKEYDAEKYIKNREIILQREKDRYAANPEAKKEYDKEYRQSDAGKKQNGKKYGREEGSNLILKKNLKKYIKFILKPNFVIYVIANCTKVIKVLEKTQTTTIAQENLEIFYVIDVILQEIKKRLNKKR